MKNNRKLLALALAIVMAASLFACAKESDREPVPLDVPANGGKAVVDPTWEKDLMGEQEEIPAFLTEARIRTEHEANIAYNNILNAFLTPENDYEYHENYAGAYLNGEGELVVLATSFPNPQIDEDSQNEGNILSDILRIGTEAFNDRSEEFKGAALELYALADAKEGVDVFFQEARYSYSYLSDMMYQLSIICLDNCSNADSIWSQVPGFSLLDERNRICIKILNIDETKIERLLSETNCEELLCFENAEAFAEPQLSMWAGHIVTGTKHGSIGYRAQRYNSSSGTYQYGFVTAGHVISKNQNAMKGTTKIGVCRDSKLDANMDAAFVEADSGWTMEVQTSYGYTIVPGLQLPTNGTSIFKEGNSTGRTYAKVISNCATSIYTSLGALYNLIESDYYSYEGDSGGIVYTSSNVVAGVHIQGPGGTGTVGARYATAATRIYAGISSSDTVAPYY